MIHYDLLLRNIITAKREVRAAEQTRDSIKTAAAMDALLAAIEQAERSYSAEHVGAFGAPQNTVTR